MQHLYVGLMSGTSVDGIDAALVDFSKIVPTVIDFQTFSYPPQLRDDIQALCTPGDDEINRMGKADRAIGLAFADACSTLLERNEVSTTQITAIGSHGQTIRHYPQGEHGFTVQIGDPHSIAAATGIDVIADFRRKDIALGGQGAPLAPAFHRAIFGDHHQSRAVVNIGGIANVTYLPREPARPVIGFDTGPGNTLMDAWCLQHTGHRYDANGQWAAGAKACSNLLEQMLAHPYFSQPPPKSTGRELFNMAWLNQQLAILNRSLTPQAVQATLAELTSLSIARHIHQFDDIEQVYLCGGGAQNDFLVECLESELYDCTVSTTEELGIHPDAVEAVAFAWLAYTFNQNQPNSLASVTGATREAVLGAKYLAG